VAIAGDPHVELDQVHAELAGGADRLEAVGMKHGFGTAAVGGELGHAAKLFLEGEQRPVFLAR
jgi:hypothetical protein